MKVYRGFKELEKKCHTVVALGNFDGVHLGHQEILATAVEKAREKGCLSSCCTFSNHPRCLFQDMEENHKKLGYLCSDEEKLHLIEQSGIDIVFDLPFNQKIMKMVPEKFVSEILVNKIGTVGVSCGFNYHYGAKAEGDTKQLAEAGKKYGFDIYVHEPVMLDGEIVSSTTIRRAIENGDMEKASRFLGRPYVIGGIVISGDHLGNRIGFPTANIRYDKSRVDLPNGVYFSETRIDNNVYYSVTNIGIKPTVGSAEKTIETFIFDFHQNLYGKYIEVALLFQRRLEVKFDSIEILAQHISEDKEAAIKFHERRKKQKVGKFY